MTGTELIKFLKKQGWQVLRSQGSHYRLGKGNRRTTVPVHGSRSLGVGFTEGD